jgi:hypothetical protein
MVRSEDDIAGMKLDDLLSPDPGLGAPVGHATALDRNELGALLVAAGLEPSSEHALISLLALNGLRVSEATGASVGPQ